MNNKTLFIVLLSKIIHYFDLQDTFNPKDIIVTCSSCIEYGLPEYHIKINEKFGEFTCGAISDLYLYSERDAYSIMFDLFYQHFERIGFIIKPICQINKI